MTSNKLSQWEAIPVLATKLMYYYSSHIILLGAGAHVVLAVWNYSNHSMTKFTVTVVSIYMFVALWSLKDCYPK